MTQAGMMHLPWRVRHGTLIIEDSRGEVVANMKSNAGWRYNKPEPEQLVPREAAEAKATLIVEAVNAVHEVLGDDEPPFEEEQVMVSVNGKTFRCECGGNVQTKIAPNRFRCNSCLALYIGEKRLS